MGVQLVIFAILNYGLLLGAFALVPLYLSTEFLPNEAMVRMGSLFSAVEGQPLDSSAVKTDRPCRGCHGQADGTSHGDGLVDQRLDA